MKRIFTAAVVLVILAQILFAVTAEASALTPPEFVVADAYKTYYEILETAINEYGVVKKNRDQKNLSIQILGS